MMETILNPRITLNLTAWLGDLQHDLNGLLGDLMQVCGASNQQKYSDNVAAPRFGPVQIVVQASAEDAPMRAARAAFLGAVGKFISLLDRLIASERIRRNGMVPDREIEGLDAMNAFLHECMEAEVAKVARDQSLTNPKKLECFSGIPEHARDAALAYFVLRRTLEHHHDVLSKIIPCH